MTFCSRERILVLQKLCTFLIIQIRNTVFCKYINERVSEEIRPVSHEHPQLRELRCSLFLLMVSNISNTSRTYDQSITFFLPSPQASKYFRELSLIKYLMIMVSNISESHDHSSKIRLPSYGCSSKKSHTVAANAIDLEFWAKPAMEGEAII